MKQHKTANHQELVRRHYLTMMGIQNWYPKFEFTNARAARNLSGLSALTPSLCLATQINKPPAKQNITKANNPVETTSNQTIITQPENQAQSYLPVKAAEPVKKVIADNLKSCETNTPYLQQEKIASLQPAKSTNQPNKIYNLLVWNPINGYLIISDMCNLKSNVPSHQSKGLLNKILKALRIEASIDKSPKEFIWPPSNRGVFKNLYNDFNSTVEAFSAFLTYQFDFNNQKKIIIFGSEAAKVVQGNNRGIKLTRGIQQCNLTNKIFAITYSLGNIIADPSIKPVVWQDISGLTALV